MAELKSYRVVWQADIDAESPQDAANKIMLSIENNEFNVFALYEWKPGPEYIPVCFAEVSTHYAGRSKFHNATLLTGENEVPEKINP